MGRFGLGCFGECGSSRPWVKSALGQVGLVISAWSFTEVLYSLLYSIIRMPVPFFLCVLLKMFNKSLREYLYPWSVNHEYISLLNGSNNITACKERKMYSLHKVLAKKTIIALFARYGKVLKPSLNSRPPSPLIK